MSMHNQPKSKAALIKDIENSKYFVKNERHGHSHLEDHKYYFKKSADYKNKYILRIATPDGDSNTYYFEIKSKGYEFTSKEPGAKTTFFNDLKQLEEFINKELENNFKSKPKI